MFGIILLQIGTKLTEIQQSGCVKLNRPRSRNNRPELLSIAIITMLRPQRITVKSSQVTFPPHSTEPPLDESLDNTANDNNDTFLYKRSLTLAVIPNYHSFSEPSVQLAQLQIYLQPAKIKSQYFEVSLKYLLWN